MKLVYVLSLFLISCASVKPLKEDNFKVPLDLDKKTQDKFEVMEVAPKVVKVKKTIPKIITKTVINKELIKIVDSSLINLKEKQELKVYFKGIDAGRVILQTLGIKEINKRSIYHFRANVYNQPFFYSLYPINELADSFVDVETFSSYRFQLKAKEGSKDKEILNLIDYDSKKIKLYEKENGKVTINKDVDLKEESLQDLLSVFFYARWIAYDKHPDVSLKVISGDKIKTVFIKYLKTENVPSIFGKETKSLKLSLKVQDKPYEYLIWLSDDKKRAMVKAESEVRVGKIKVELLKYD